MNTQIDQSVQSSGPAQQYLVTGAAGFVGSHLCCSLVSQGHSVVGVDNFDPFYERSLKEHNVSAIDPRLFRLVEADICDAQAMERLTRQTQPDCILHIAALAGVRPSIADPARYALVNVNGLLNVLNAAVGAECPRIIFASSSSVYGNSQRIPFVESDPSVNPISPYAATKRSGELLCHAFAHLHGINIACLRLFTVYGPAQRPDLAISKFMRLIADGRPVPMFGDGSTSRDYTYVDDIVSGMLSADQYLRRAAAGTMRIWNLGHCSPISLLDMIRTIGRVVGKEPRIRQQSLQPGDVQRTWADLAKSRADLGYEPAVDFESGLARQWQWLQSMREPTLA